ncbi:MAG: protein-(glutamine-N5) methyltransferase, release factor-specific [Burkholderiales bacterium PBB3]|nr:MAG: protein-(glutamine-N5) methyltransferase, release factor-specific [Burkholderiales bacterium PBB3]
MTSIDNTLQALQSRGLSRLEAQRLLLKVLGRDDHDRAWLLAHGSELMDAAASERLENLVQLHLDGHPLAYLLGHQAFYGLDLVVDARVLVPRPDTETLVDWALEVLSTALEAPVIDLGTGSGAIALALKATRADLQVSALDFSEDALTVARANAQRLQLEVNFRQGSWLNGVAEQFQAIVSNPPYIAAQDHHLAALVHEPLAALASGADGLDDIRTLIAQAPTRLLAGGWLLLEHGYDQAAAVRALLLAAGFTQVQSRQDLAGIERCSGGQWQAASKPF